MKPTIRFKNFSDEWHAKELGEVARFLNGRAYKQTELLPSGKYPVLRVGNFFTNPNWYYSNLELDPDKYCETGDLLYAWSASFGPRIWSGEKVIYHYHIWKVEPSEHINQKFLYYILDRDVERIKGEQGAGIAMVHITKQGIEERAARIPSLEEQQKIADFLTSVDTRIRQLKQKQSLLQQYKKGLMQKLFSQELRFKDDSGDSFADWRSGVFGDLAVKTSSNITSASVNAEGPHLVYGASGKAGYIEYFQNQNQYVGIVKDGAGAGRVALCEPKTSVLATMDALHPKEAVDVNYLFQFIQTLRFAKYVIGSTIPHIYFSDYKAEKCQIPCLEEQTKIASALAAMDKKIDLVAQQIEHTQIFKKGLLQQMFV